MNNATTKRAMAAEAKRTDTLLDAWLDALASGTREEEAAAREVYHAALHGKK